MANTYISRTFGTPTNSAIWTLSFWIKRSSLSGTQKFFSAGTGSTDRTEMYFATGGNISIYKNLSGSTAGLNSTRIFRDTNSWYHFVIQNNNGTATVYCNGETVSLSSTSLGTNKINLASTIHIFGDSVASGENFDGLMSHIHFIDGTAYNASAFGETDTTTGEWKGKTSPSVTYGNNGLFIFKDGNGITDQSGRGNNFTLSSGTLTDLKDNPDNTFATMNPLYRTTNVTFSNGNNTITSSSSSWNAPASTLAVSTGKWYVEGKATGYNHNAVGVTSNPNGGSAAYPFEIVGGYGYKFYSGGKTSMGADDVAYGNTLANGDIFQIALDLDNSKIYFGKNGTWQNSGVPTSGSTGTGSAFTLPSGETYHFVNALNSQSGGASSQWNFGNGYFGTTAITTNSGNGYSGAEGSSKFNYTVPTGYSALSTKGLNE